MSSPFRAIVLFVIVSIIPITVCPAQSQGLANMVVDPSFENYPFQKWYVDLSVRTKGIAVLAITGVKSGRYALKLLPDSTNGTSLATGTFGVGQLLNLESTRGKSLYFSGWMRVHSGATAVLRLIAFQDNGRLIYRELRQETPTFDPVFRRDILDVPKDPGILAVFIVCSVEGTSGAAYFDDIVVSDRIPEDWASARGDPDFGPDLSAVVNVNADKTIGTIPRTIYGANVEWVWNGNGIWDEKKDALDTDMIRLGKDLGTSLLRFPGGFFSDFYHWREGIGSRNSRPQSRMLAAGSLSPNNFGTEEALQYAEATGSNLLITVNVATGTAEEAADWVRYVNNGQRRVEYWEIGNELYVDLSKFDRSVTAIPPDEYARRFLEYAAAMRAVDPTIKLGAVLDFNYGATTYRAYPDWTDVVLRIAGPEIDFVAVHNAFAPVLYLDEGLNARMVYSSMLAAPLEIKDTLRKLVQKIHDINGADSRIRIGLSEWGPLFHDDPSSRFVDHGKTLGSALFVASLLKAMIEEPRMMLATAFKLVDGLTTGWIGTRHGEYIPKAPYYALEMYARHFGSVLVDSQTVSPTYETRSIGWVDSIKEVPYLEAIASRGEDNQTLYIMVINKHFDRAVQGQINLQGFCASEEAMAWTLNGTAIDANTGTELVPIPGAPQWADQVSAVPDGRFQFGSPEEVQMVGSPFRIDGPPQINRFFYYFPPHSVTSLILRGSGQSCPENPPDSEQPGGAFNPR